MRKLTLLILLVVHWGYSQEKKVTKTGEITFEASVPSFEEVKATNKSVTFIMNTETGEIASLALIKAFRFKVALMEEHFNENYAESDRYPKATFKGKINAFDKNKITETAKDFLIKGTLEMHGKSKDIIAPAKIKKIGNDIEIITNFSVNSDDFAIKIPSVVSKKVSKKVNISVYSLLK